MNCYLSPEIVGCRTVLANRKQRSYDRNMATVIKNSRGAGMAVVMRAGMRLGVDEVRKGSRQVLEDLLGHSKML